MTTGRFGMGGVTLVALALAAPAAWAVTVTRGPYLQTPTPDSVIVRWRTDVATDSRVSYGAAPGSLTSIADDPTATTEHIVTVSTLSPDTLSYYAIGSVGGALVGDDTDHHFRTPPVVGPARPTRIWLTGDGGFANANGLAVRDAYAAYNAGNETDLWIMLGDNAYVLGTDADYQTSLFNMHHDLLRQTPVWSTFGNHEAISSNDTTQTGPYFDMFSFPTAGEAGGVASGTEAYYAFDFANIHFIVLDSENASTLPGSAMRLWLDADLQATTADWILAIWHRPPYSKGVFHDSDTEANEINLRQNVVPVLENYGVDLVLTGHSHSYERSYLLDGHYGFSGTFTPAMSLDSGSGNPATDGAYRKPDGQVPHEGAVYVVAGSSSEVRVGTLNHPAMRVGLLQLGSLILDVNGNTLTARFLNDAVQVTDTFTMIKGSPCPATPRPGCGAAPEGRLVLKKNALTSAKDSLVWRWRKGMLPPSGIGTPDTQTDLAFCLYDGAGVLVGTSISHGADPVAGAAWRRSSNGRLSYRNSTASESGVTAVKLRPDGSSPFPVIVVKGKGTNLALPTPPRSLPLTAQLANLEGSACYESVFATTEVNDVYKVVAEIP